MPVFNYASHEMILKIVYYGPALCGKTTNLQFIYQHIPEDKKGKMLSLATDADRTLFFDFLPIELGSIQGWKIRVQLYTVPGQVFYDATRRLVLRGADGVVFVADSQKEMLEANIESWENMKENLAHNGLDFWTIPLVIQYNKRDLKNILPVEVLNERLNERNVPYFEAIATEGVGVMETLREIIKQTLQTVQSRMVTASTSAGEASPQEVATPEPAVAQVAGPPEGGVEVPAEPAVDAVATAGAALESVAAPGETVSAEEEMTFESLDDIMEELEPVEEIVVDTEATVPAEASATPSEPAETAALDVERDVSETQERPAEPTIAHLEQTLLQSPERAVPEELVEDLTMELEASPESLVTTALMPESEAPTGVEPAEAVAESAPGAPEAAPEHPPDVEQPEVPERASITIQQWTLHPEVRPVQIEVTPTPSGFEIRIAFDITLHVKTHEPEA